MKNAKIIIFIFVIIAALFILSEMSAFAQVTDYAAITSVVFEDNAITVSGTLSESATSYQGYKTEIQGDSLYISIKTGLSFINKATDYNIRLENMGEIKNVFYKGRTGSHLLASRP